MFGQLPSYVLANATMFDLVVASTLAEHKNNQMNPGSKAAPNLSQEEMMNMIKRVRERKND